MTGEEKERRRRRVIFGSILVVLIILILLLLNFCSTRTVIETLHPLDKGPVLALGDAVVTGFSGVKEPDPKAPLPTGKSTDDMTFINLDGPSVRVFNPRAPGFVWNGSYWAMPHRRDIPASAVGQVFGVTLDNATYPDIFLTATSAYGLNLFLPTNEGHIKRVKKGEPGARWAAGQFGPDGGPGSIWKVDGKTGAVTHFADVTLDGVASGPAGLGNITYDEAHRQLFVSDLSTGMIHRFDLNGKELSIYDHGVTGRKAVGFTRIAYDPATRVSIESRTFNTEKPETWGFADAQRRVWGLAIHEGRLYYAVARGPVRDDGHGKPVEDRGQIWSVSLTKTGEIAGDARVEVTLTAASDSAPISDIIFAHDGAMIVAERAIMGATYGYEPLAAEGTARVYRFWKETPNDKETPSDWYQAPEEYGVGYEGDSRASAGGVALGYGYDSDGKIVFDDCEDAIFFTGGDLRHFHRVNEDVLPDGDLSLTGLQMSPKGPVREFNVPAKISYFTNYADEMTSDNSSGRVGDVAVYHFDCAKPSCVGVVAGGVTSVPVKKDVAVLPPPGGPPPGGPPPGGPPPCVGLGCGPVPVCVGPDCGHTECEGPDCGGCVGPDCGECVGPACPPDNPQMCMKVEGEAVCDPDEGGWVYRLTAQDTAGIGLDTLTVQSATIGVSVSNGPDITVVPPPGVIGLTGATPGQTVTLNVCGFDSVARKSGEPYDCCHSQLSINVPNGMCDSQHPKGE